MVNLQFYTIDVHVLVHTKITSTMHELNNVIQIADNIHQHVTPATKGFKLPSQKYMVCVLCFQSLLLLVEAFSYQRPQRLRPKAN